MKGMKKLYNGYIDGGPLCYRLTRNILGWESRRVYCCLAWVLGLVLALDITLGRGSGVSVGAGFGFGVGGYGYYRGYRPYGCYSPFYASYYPSVPAYYYAPPVYYKGFTRANDLTTGCRTRLSAGTSEQSQPSPEVHR